MAFALCLSAFGFTQIDSGAQATASTPPEDVALRIAVEKFFAACGKKDLSAVVALWSEKSPNLASHKQKLVHQFNTEDLSFGSPEISRVKVGSAKASLRVTIALSSIDLKSRQKNEQRLVSVFEFVKESGEWKVWRSAPAAEDLAGALAKTDSKAERAELLAEEKELVTVELGQALLMQGRRLDAQGIYAQATKIYGLTMDVAEQLNDKKVIAYALLGMGNVCRRQGNYTEALEQYQKSLKIAEEIADKVGVAFTINNIGVVHLSQGNYTEALEEFHKSLRLSEEISYYAGAARALHNIGNIYRSQGNYIQALEQYQKCLKISEETGEKTSMATTLNNVGIVYKIQGNYRQALEQYQKCLKISEEIGDRAEFARALNNIGIIHELQGNYTEALEQYQQSLKIKEEIGDKAGIAATLNNMGSLLDSQGNYTQALEQYQKSLKIKEERGDRGGVAITLINIGEIHRLKGNYTQALQFTERAGDIATQIGAPEFFWNARAIAGKTYMALNQLDLARQSFEEAITTIESLRANVAGGEQERQRFFESKVSPYHAMVELLITRNNPGEALTYAERAEARALLDVLSSGRVSVTKTMTGPEIEQERKLNGQLVSLNTQIYREKQLGQPDPNRINQLDSQVQKARLDLEAFETNLYAAHPELKTRRGEAPLLRLEQASALLPDAGAALLEFVVADEKTYLFVLTKETSVGIKVYPLEIKRKDLADRIGRFRQMLSTSDNRFSKPAHDLYDLLLKPAAAELGSKTRLVIVPDGPLWELPFQALQTPKDRYLIDDYAISYAPSLTVLREMIHARRTKEARPFAATLLALGNPSLGQQTIARVKTVMMDAGLDPLPEAEQQVRTLAKIYGSARSKVYVGAEAREERFKSEAKDFRILHLATHGILDDRSPMYSHLLLAQTGEATEGTATEDGMLEAWELMKMDLKADLAVLSACETARGRVGKGEGMIGLTWALFVAGVPTTVVSQWKVRSDSTAELMVEFHRRLKTGFSGSSGRHSAAEALRAAALKLKTDRRYQHPFHWASFVVIGDGY